MMSEAPNYYNKLTAGFAQKDVLSAAMDYADAGFSIIPCRVDKRPAIDTWKQYQTERANPLTVSRWFDNVPHSFTGIPGSEHPSIGFVCGRVSQNVVVIDLDGLDAVSAFYHCFPGAKNFTLTVQSGSGNGEHLYFRVDKMPANINVHTNVGGFEIRGEGCYVIAPPSPHPSGGKYTVKVLENIRRVPHLEHVRKWFESLRESNSEHRNAQIKKNAQPVRVQTSLYKQRYLQTVVSQETARVTSAAIGNRNQSLFYATLRLANYCAGGELNRHDMEALLLGAAAAINMPTREAERTIQSGMNIGWKRPRQVPPPTSE